VLPTADERHPEHPAPFRVLPAANERRRNLGLEGLHLGVISATSRRNLGLEGLHLGDC
jgi:hypothetical protein